MGEVPKEKKAHGATIGNSSKHLYCLAGIYWPVSSITFLRSMCVASYTRSYLSKCNPWCTCARQWDCVLMRPQVS